MNINTKQAYTYQVACEEGSIRAAADRLELEASSVSRQIKALEKSLAIDLIERSRNGIIPTEAGNILLQYLRHQESELEAVLSEFDALRGMRQGHLVIGLGDGFINDFIVNTLDNFQKKYSGFQYTLQSGSTDQIIHTVKTDQAHMGFTFNAPSDKNIRLVTQKQQPLKLMVSSSSPWAQLDDPISIDTLKTLPMALLSQGFGIGAMVHDMEHSYSIRLNSIVNANSLQTLKSVVSDNIGVTILPSFVVIREINEGKIIAKTMDIPELEQGEVSIIVRRSRRLSQGVTTLINSAVQNMAAFH